MHNKRLIVVLGKVASGKSTFAQTLINHTQIDIGSIVREIKKQEERVHNQSLDKQIIQYLDYKLLLNRETNFVITGIRQYSILKHLIYNSSSLDDIDLIWLEVSKEELKRRFLNRQFEKDKDLTFEEVIKRDAELGLTEIENFIEKNQSLFTIIKNY